MDLLCFFLLPPSAFGVEFPLGLSTFVEITYAYQAVGLATKTIELFIFITWITVIVVCSVIAALFVVVQYCCVFLSAIQYE